MTRCVASTARRIILVVVVVIVIVVIGDVNEPTQGFSCGSCNKSLAPTWNDTMHVCMWVKEWARSSGWLIARRTTHPHTQPPPTTGGGCAQHHAVVRACSCDCTMKAYCLLVLTLAWCSEQPWIVCVCVVVVLIVQVIAECIPCATNISGSECNGV